jgi:hypothetical protein
MGEYDEELLEAGIANGLDIPTALAAAKRDEQPNPSGCGRIAVGPILLAVGVYLLACRWLR